MNAAPYLAVTWNDADTGAKGHLVIEALVPALRPVAEAVATERRQLARRSSIEPEETWTSRIPNA